MKHTPSETTPNLTPDSPRRNFLFEFWTATIGIVASIFPFLTGVATVLDPLRRSHTGSKEFLGITNLAALPDDGIPRQFPVIRALRDAWTYSAGERIGAVYLRRLPGSQEVQAFNVVCPHAGCFVGYEGGKTFQCPCHTSSFTLDGEIIRPSPSPRDMDSLATRVADDGTIEVAFVNFYPGKHEPIEKQ